MGFEGGSKFPPEPGGRFGECWSLWAGTQWEIWGVPVSVGREQLKLAFASESSWGWSERAIFEASEEPIMTANEARKRLLQ